jgi:hypothetical protein
MAKQAKRQLAGSGEAIPSGAIGEEKIAYGTSVATSVANTEIDVPGASITLEPGVWDLEYSADVFIERAAVGAAVVGRTRITDSSNTGESGTEGVIYLVFNTVVAISIGNCISKKKRVTITSGNKTYKLRIVANTNTADARLYAGVNELTGGISGNESSTFIRAVRIA